MGRRGVLDEAEPICNLTVSSSRVTLNMTSSCLTLLPDGGCSTAAAGSASGAVEVEVELTGAGAVAEKVAPSNASLLNAEEEMTTPVVEVIL